MKTERKYVKCRSTNAVRTPNKTGNVRYAESQCKVIKYGNGDVTLSILRLRDGKTARVEFDIDEWVLLVKLALRDRRKD